MTIWKSIRSVEELNSGRPGTLVGHLGIEFTEITDDSIRGTMPVDERTRKTVVQPTSLQSLRQRGDRV